MWCPVDRLHVAFRRAIVAGVIVLGIWLPAGRAAEAPPVPVIVELFTSQGCSSCPPADAVLRSLERLQPVAGLEIIPLSEHVDYWNRLGWLDPFSSPRFSARQRDYGMARDIANLYTPMMVVDGRTVLVGSDGDLAQQAIREAGVHPKTRLRLDVEVSNPGEVIEVVASIDEPRPDAGEGPVEIWLAITESGLATDVMAGENMFRRLTHTGVVRHLERLATLALTDVHPELPIAGRIRLEDGWDPARLRAVVFLQDPVTLAITGAVAAVVPSTSLGLRSVERPRL